LFKGPSGSGGKSGMVAMGNGAGTWSPHLWAEGRGTEQAKCGSELICLSIGRHHHQLLPWGHAGTL